MDPTLEQMLGRENLALLKERLNWKANSDLMYDIIREEELEWPSLTVQWLPGVCISPDGVALQQLILGTQTSGAEQNMLIVANIQLPEAASDESDDSDQEDFGSAGAKKKKIDPDANADVEEDEDCVCGFSHNLPHDGDVNKARFMPQAPNLIATKSGTGVVYLFDTSKPAPADQPKSAHQMMMAGTAADGFALAWNPLRANYLLSGDSVLCCWDTAAGPQGSALRPLFTNQGHSDAINDVAWLSHSTCASVSDDKTLRVWDIRDATKVTSSLEYSGGLNALGFTTEDEHHLLTGAADGHILRWDLRKLSLKDVAYTFSGHSKAVFSIQFSPFHPSVFASAGNDRDVLIWDMDGIGKPPREEEDEEPVPSELLFKHSGHTSPVSDISWNLNGEKFWVMASVQAEGNVLHVWKPSQSLLEEEEDEEEGKSEKIPDSEPEQKRRKV